MADDEYTTRKRESGPSPQTGSARKDDLMSDYGRSNAQDTSFTKFSSNNIRNPNINVLPPIQPLLSHSEFESRRHLPSICSHSEERSPNFTHHPVLDHPWAKYVTVRHRPFPSSEDCVTSFAPLKVYRPIPNEGYSSNEFVQTLFPRPQPQPCRTRPLPVFELMRLQDAVYFRKHSLDIIRQLQESNYVAREIQEPETPPGTMATTVLPLPWRSTPVLYQVVARDSDKRVILEAKDFFIAGPDRAELQCIVLTEFSTNIRSGTRGFDCQLVSFKDFVWVYSVEPTAEALRDPVPVLIRARTSRTTILDSIPYFFQVREFVFVTPPKAPRQVYGLVIEDGNKNESSFEIVFEGALEAVTVSPSIFQFTRTVKKHDIVRAETRSNVSSAIRFSESPASASDQLILCSLVSGFKPFYRKQERLPLKIFDLSCEEWQWINDRIGEFTNYSEDLHSAHVKMTHLFAMAYSSLSAIACKNGDKSIQRVTATISAVDVFPIRFYISLNTSPDCGWEAYRVVLLRVVGAPSAAIVLIQSTEPNLEDGTLSVQLVSPARSYHSLRRAIHEFGRKENGVVLVDICIKLGRFFRGRMKALQEATSGFKLLDNIMRGTECRATQVLDAVYNNSSKFKLDGTELLAERRGKRIHFGGNVLQLHSEQVAAIRLGCGDQPIVVIQAPFGAGKTMVAAVTAARIARQRKGHVIVVATSNDALAQFTDTILKLDKYRDLSVLRYVSDSTPLCGKQTTVADMNYILKRLSDDYAEHLSPEDLSICLRFNKRREVLERFSWACENEKSLPQSEWEEYCIAEEELPTLTTRVVSLLFKLRTPAVICITTSSLLNETQGGGILKEILKDCHTVIGDNASHISELEFVAIANRLCHARHVYIGDTHQLQPYVDCARTSLPAVLGAGGLMELLIKKRVPVVYMNTTHRGHPELNKLPNELFYDGTLISGVSEHERRMFLDHVRCRNPVVPFLFVDLDQSSLSLSGSCLNAQGARICRTIATSLLAKGIEPESLAIIIFHDVQGYSLKQFAKKHSIDLVKVGSMQSREKEIVILLTPGSNGDSHFEDEILNDGFRINLALTRCRHGQFVLGSKQFLSTLSSWAAIIRWAEDRDALINEDDLSNIFA